MNAPLFIFSPDAKGQPASILTGSTSAGGDNAFADSLAAALAASTLTSPLPVQQQAATPVNMIDGSLMGGEQHLPETAAVDQALSSPLGQGTGLAKSAGALGIGSGSNPVGPAAGRPDDNAPAAGVRTINPLIAGAEGSAAAAPVETASFDMGAPDAEGTMVRAAGHQVPVESGHAAFAPGEAHAVRPVYGLSSNQSDLRIEGDRPAGASVSAEQGRSPTVSPERPRAHPSIDTPVTAARPLEAVPSADDLLARSLQARPSADIVRDEVDRPAGRLDSAVPVNRAAQALSQIALAQLQTTAPGTLPVSMPRGSSGRPIEMPNGPIAANAPIDIQGNGSILAASRPENMPLAAGSTSSHRQAEPAVGPTKAAASASPAKSLADPSRPIDMRGVETRSDRSPGVQRDHVGGPTASVVNTAHLVQPAAQDPNAQQGIGATAIDRLQPALSLEGALQEVERFEPATSLAPSKAAPSAAQSSASAQVALQIVRSLPRGIDRLSLQLHPAELGSVDIRLDFEASGRMTAVITAERPETLELLQRDSRLLERSLGDNGLKLANDGLSFSLKQDQPQQQGQSFQDQAQARQAAVQAGRAYDDTPDLEQPSSTMRVDGLRLLDIKT